MYENFNACIYGSARVDGVREIRTKVSSLGLTNTSKAT